MDFDLTEEQRRRCTAISTEVSERLGDHPPPLAVSRESWKVAADIGLTGLCLPVAEGGGGLGALDTALCLEAFGRSCGDTGLVFAVAAHLLAAAVSVRDFAGEAVRAELVSGLARGRLIGANAMTEESAGSDVGRLAARAERDGDHYVLDGHKSFVSNAPVADLFVTYAVTDSKAGFLGVSAFVVPRELPGVVVEEPLDKLGLDGCPAAAVRFVDCRVPARYVLDEPGQGGAVFQHAMGWERACLLAGYLGLMQRQLESCVERVTTRRQFGRPIADFQAVSHRVTAMRQRLESARLLLYRGCWLLDAGREHVGAVALGKVATSEAAVANALDAMQIFGAAGYLTTTGVERQLRDALPTTVFSGTSEIQRELIAREMGL